jgi:hypothetical protein
MRLGSSAPKAHETSVRRGGWSVAEPWVTIKDGTALKERQNVSDADGIDIRSKAISIAATIFCGHGSHLFRSYRAALIIIRIPRVPLRSTLG